MNKNHFMKLITIGRPWKHDLLTESWGCICHSVFSLLLLLEQEDGEQTERTCDVTLHLRRNDTTRAPWKLRIAPLNILPQSALGSKMTSFQICSLTAVAARDHARRLSAPQPNQFLSPLAAFSARRFSNAGAIIKCPASAFSVSPHKRSVVLVASATVCNFLPSVLADWRAGNSGTPDALPGARQPRWAHCSGEGLQGSDSSTDLEQTLMWTSADAPGSQGREKVPLSLLTPAPSNPSARSVTRLRGSSHPAWAKPRSKVASAVLRKRLSRRSSTLCFRRPSGDKWMSSPGFSVSFFFSAFTFRSITSQTVVTQSSKLLRLSVMRSMEVAKDEVFKPQSFFRVEVSVCVWRTVVPTVNRQRVRGTAKHLTGSML